LSTDSNVGTQQDSTSGTDVEAPNPDIRSQIGANRGIGKKIELLIPGLKTYRKLDDIRVADNILRVQVANKLDQTKSNLEDLRKRMVANNDFTNLSAISPLIFELQQLSGQVRHAEMGYSGFVAPIQMDQTKLNKLYDYDNNFVSAADDLQERTMGIRYDPTSPNSIQTALTDVSNLFTTFKQSWAVRIEAIQGVLVK
jgi:uncharacterized tellurite resistance protein B-like protein